MRKLYVSFFYYSQRGVEIGSVFVPYTDNIVLASDIETLRTQVEQEVHDWIRPITIISWNEVYDDCDSCISSEPSNHIKGATQCLDQNCFDSRRKKINENT